MHLKVLEEGDEGALDQFVAAHPWGSIEQTWAWGDLQTRIPGRPEFRVFGVWEGEGGSGAARLVASLLVIRQEMGFGKTWLWAPRGPLLPVGDAEMRAEAWALLQEAAKNWARLHGDVFLRVEPGWEREAAPAGEFELGGRATSETYVPAHSLVLDLSVGEAGVLAQMTQKGRYNIKVAEKHKVVVRDGGVAALPAFYAVFKETAGRDGFYLHKEEFYRDFLAVLGERAALYVASVDGEVVGGLMVTFFGDTGTYYFGASSGQFREAMAPYALQWHAIREALGRGLKVYDFFGIAPEGDEQHAWAGVTQFKTRFGGRRVNYEKARVFVYRRAWWWIYRFAKWLRRS